MFFLINGNGVVFKVEQHFHLTVTLVFEVAFDNCLLEVTKEAKNMAIKMNPIRLVELRRIPIDIFGVEMVMAG